MSNAAIYARVSSARQKEQETIGSQTAALRAHAEQLGLEVPEQWMFCDDGHSGATLVRPALEKLRDLVAQVPVEVVLVYSPDRLARKYAYQALLIEEFAKAGSSVIFVKGPSSDSPEDALLVQFQSMIAEYERAQIIERTRRGKTHRARQGTVNVLSGAPFGYRYVRKNEHVDARYCCDACLALMFRGAVGLDLHQEDRRRRCRRGALPEFSIALEESSPHPAGCRWPIVGPARPASPRRTGSHAGA